MFGQLILETTDSIILTSGENGFERFEPGKVYPCPVEQFLGSLALITKIDLL